MTEDTDENRGRGAPEGNDNAVKHGLFRDKDKMYKNLDTSERRFVVKISEDLLDRLEGDIGAYEREVIRNLALDTLKRRKANEYFAEKGFDVNSEKANKVYSKLRRDNIKEMKEMGLEVRSPDAREASAKESWFDAIREAEEDDE